MILSYTLECLDKNGGFFHSFIRYKSKEPHTGAYDTLCAKTVWDEVKAKCLIKTPQIAMDNG